MFLQGWVVFWPIFSCVCIWTEPFSRGYWTWALFQFQVFNCSVWHSACVMSLTDIQNISHWSWSGKKKSWKLKLCMNLWWIRLNSFHQKKPQKLGALALVANQEDEIPAPLHSILWWWYFRESAHDRELGPVQRGEWTSHPHDQVFCPLGYRSATSSRQTRGMVLSWRSSLNSSSNEAEMSFKLSFAFFGLWDRVVGNTCLSHLPPFSFVIQSFC